MINVTSSDARLTLTKDKWKQPNLWTCYPTAVSILTGIPVEKLIKALGHDGSKVTRPELKEPACREAYTHSEMCFALFNLGYMLGFIAAKEANVDGVVRTNYPEFTTLCSRLGTVPCIIVCKESDDHGHCYAWIDDKVIDPKIGDYVDPAGLYIESLEPLVKIHRSRR